jgi:hypothetical protein
MAILAESIITTQNDKTILQDINKLPHSAYHTNNKIKVIPWKAEGSNSQFHKNLQPCTVILLLTAVTNIGFLLIVSQLNIVFFILFNLYTENINTIIKQIDVLILNIYKLKFKVLYTPMHSSTVYKPLKRSFFHVKYLL